MKIKQNKFTHLTFRAGPHPPPQPRNSAGPQPHVGPQGTTRLSFSSKHHTIDPHLLDIHPSHRARQKRHPGDRGQPCCSSTITPTWCDWQLLRLTIVRNWDYATPVQRI